MSKPIENPIVEFGNALQAYGLVVSQVNDDGALHKCKCAHDKGKKTSGRYFLHSDGKANGKFGCYHDHDNALGCTWESNTPDVRTDAEKAAAKQQYAIQAAKREAQSQAERDEAAIECKRLWGMAHDANSAHAYLANKGVQAYGLKSLNGALLVPVYDGKNTIENLTSIQFIQPDGSKQFKTGGKKQGCYFSFGSTDTQTVVICEGYSTGASIAQATGHRIVVAFDAGNLKAVSRRIHETLPDGWTMVIAADNDAYGLDNKGLSQATAAAQSTGALLALPCFDGMDVSTTPTDFNDLHQLAGLEAVKAAFAPENLSKPVIENPTKPHTETVSEETDDDFIKRLARFSPLEFARQKKGAAERLGITQGDLKGLIKDAQSKGKATGESGTSIINEEVEPFDSPVDGAALLDEVVEQLRLHVITDKETLHAAALWVCLTWLVDYASVLPLAVVTAPEKGCGKTTLLNAMMKMSCKPCPASGISSAGLFRTIEAFKPTLFIDEADTFLKDNEELRGVINSGHTRDMAFIIRTVGESFEPKQFSTWCAKAISGIGHLPETIESRSIILKMRRKVKGEHANNIRHANPQIFALIKRKLARWSDDNALAFSELHPVMDGLNNRDADNYEPLLAIAMLAGGEWVARVKNAAHVLTAHSEENRSIGVELLEACRAVFDTQHVDKIKSVDLLSEILKDEEAPFLTYNRGKPMAVKQMSRLLGNYGVKSKTINPTYGKAYKGFQRSQFDEAFSVYLDGNSENLPDTPFQIVTSFEPSTGAGSGVTILEKVTVTKTQIVTPQPSTGAGSNDVTILKGVNEKNLQFEPQSDDNGSIDDWIADYDNAAKNSKLSATPYTNDGGEKWTA